MPIVTGIRRFFARGGQQPAHQPGRSAHDAANGPLSPAAAPLVAPLPSVGEELRAAIVKLVEQLDRQQLGTSDVAAALEPLPRLAESLGDLRRQGMSINETLAEHAERSHRATEQANSLLQRVGDSLAGQGDVVAGVQQQMDALVRTFGGLSDDLERVRGSLAEIATHASSSATTLAGIAERQQAREERVLSLVRTFGIWVVALLLIAAGAAVTGVVIVAGR